MKTYHYLMDRETSYISRMKTAAVSVDDEAILEKKLKVFESCKKFSAEKKKKNERGSVESKSEDKAKSKNKSKKSSEKVKKIRV